MKGLKAMVLAFCLAVGSILGSGAVWAGYGVGAGDGTGPLYNIYDGTAVSLTGIVASVGTFGQGLEVDTGDGLVTVYGIGSYRYWDSLGVPFPSVGEEVAVDGYEITLSDGTTRIIATSITVSGVSIELRDSETGMPLWRGGFGAGGGNAGSMGAGTAAQGGRWSR